jgi:hypothetical protein
VTGNTARDIVNRAAKNATGRDRVARVAAIILALCVAVAGVYFGPRVVDQGHQIDTLSGKLDTANVSVTKLIDQVKQLGGTPVVQPPASATSTASVDPAEVRQAARTAVAEYCAAPTHPCRGSDGSTPSFDAIVTAVVARIPTPQNGRDAPLPNYAALVASYCAQDGEPCRGPQGAKGEKGDPPPCMADASHCRGDDGQPPAGWTTSYPDGSTGSCTRAADFDPAAPRYACTRSAPPSTDPPLPLGGN